MIKMDGSDIFIYDNVSSLGAPGGVVRYFNYLREGVITHFGSRVTIFSSQFQNYGAAKHLRALPTNFRGSGLLKIPNINSFLANWISKLQHAAVFYSAYYGNFHTNAAQVYTVYDMIHELYFPKTSITQAFISQKKRCLEQARLLIAISKSTAQDILTCYPHIDPEKITTIWLGVDDFFFAASSKSENDGKPYFLYVGARKGYKNFQRAVQAFGESRLPKDFDLRIVSPNAEDKFDHDEIALISKYKLGQSVDLRLAVSDIELRASYAGATALIYPSKHEGFGLPVLEAMAAGTLVAASDKASLPEIAGNAAFYFDPNSDESIAATLVEVASISNEDREAKISQGINHARQFSWARCQQQTVKAIAQLLPN